MELSTKAIDIKGIGPKTVELYKKLGLNEAEDFLYYYPRDYMQYTIPVKPEEKYVGEIIFFRATVAKQPLLRRAGRLQIVSATLVSEGTEIRAVWFHMPYLTKSLKAGTTYVFRARLEKKGNLFSVEQPLIFGKDKFAALENTLQPIYPLTKGLSNQSLIKTIRYILDNVNISDQLNIESPSGKITKMQAVSSIHFPKNIEELKAARKKLVFEEFFLFLLKLKLLKKDNEENINDFEIYPSANAERIIEKLPYELTGAQNRVWKEVSDEITGHKSMSRLIQGDVGSGKTIIALLSAIMVADSGYQCAIMAPTEILATQHFEAVSKMIRDNNLKYKAVLLTGSQNAKTRRETLADIESGDAKIVIGTHALFQEKVIYNNLALVVTDEQHRFGVKQRETLNSKNRICPHTLVMSATPIPRTLAIILYGDLDISVIDEIPKQRLPIKNCVVNTDYREKAYQFIEKEISMSHQAYIICPLVEESEGLEAENVIDYTNKIRERFAGNENIRIAYLHGKMKPQEKNSVMDSFYKNEIQILVSTTVVEVGVNVPNATVMLIENAERFGLAQLHQLRGRIGRGNSQSYCIFMSANRSENTMKRLDILNKSNDGFKIAEEDLKQRGPGELFGLRQSGDINFALGDIYDDSDVLKEAAMAVDKLLREDSQLLSGKNQELLRYLNDYSERVYHTVL